MSFNISCKNGICYLFIDNSNNEKSLLYIIHVSVVLTASNLLNAVVMYAVIIQHDEFITLLFVLTRVTSENYAMFFPHAESKPASCHMPHAISHKKF